MFNPSLSTTDAATVAGLAFATLVVYKVFKRPSNDVPLPPGPPRDPLIGSARYFPSERIGEHMYEWQKQYGTSFPL